MMSLYKKRRNLYWDNCSMLFTSAAAAAVKQKHKKTVIHKFLNTSMNHKSHVTMIPNSSKERQTFFFQQSWAFKVS